MDELMEEDSGELIFTAIEIDLDYEFDAARYLDFTIEETPDEALHSENWFESARSYSPSPFVTKLILREDTLLQQMGVPSRSRGQENMSLQGNESKELDHHCSRVEFNTRDCKVMKGAILNNKPQHLPTGLTFPNQLTKEKSKSLPRMSTLMKPTASQLAKQNRPHQIGDPRFSKFVNKDNKKPGNNPFGIEVQAAKRQKLEGGLLHKDGGTKQQNLLIHKVTTKKEEMIIGHSTPAKMKITIPMEPELETTQRAHRRMPKDAPQPDCAVPNFRRFKARPLNKKILEAPSLLIPKRSTPRLPEFQEFHLTNSNRALKHSSATSSSFLVHEGSSDKMLNRPNVHLVEERTNRESRRPSTMDVSRLEGHDTSIHNFKARPLNMKIFSSKGDIGVFRNFKKEATVPMEFNFHTEKRRIQQNSPVVDLFNKLCLNEVQPNTQSQLQLPKSSCFIQSKIAAKENKHVSFQQEHDDEMMIKG